MKKILLVDDSQDNLDVLSFLFQDEGYTVMVMDSATNIENTINDFMPDIIFLDVMLNGENGLDVCSRIKTNPSIQTSKIVMMTASNQFSNIEKDVCLADHYLLKPFDINEVLAIVSRLLKN